MEPIYNHLNCCNIQNDKHNSPATPLSAQIAYDRSDAAEHVLTDPQEVSSELYAGNTAIHEHKQRLLYEVNTSNVAIPVL